ncbi:NHL repeat-containing protein [Pontimicrobium aquaticum]|uniref:Por secretion system C-terminal sorting domain-containing protein n=1 Tax=Pontimicrobium aquaticum TaxID=2565367 RepID=A0A4U0F0D8_9FLAO|nr:hypothetical protein [Pontimicrobium aquaticum]TJY37813.1 hypothetical protein E5167_00735 [Pontimicrobium aquaticum]
MKKNILIYALFIIGCANAQIVETLVNSGSFTMNHGCAISSNGIIYSTDVFGNGSYNGQYIYKTLSNGSTSIFVSGLFGATGLVFDQSGNLYVSELNTGKIWKVLPNGLKSIYANGTGVPAGMAFDSAGNLFVANFQYNQIMKVLPNGNVSTFAYTAAEPTGIIIDNNDNLFVSHEAPHTISKITPEGVVTTFANIPNTKLQYLTFLGEDILVASFSDHRIYKVAPNGTWSIYSGTGALGGDNGNINQATFNAPTGIGTFINGTDLYIYIVEKNRIRKITTSSLSVDTVKKNTLKINVINNKDLDELTIKFNKNVNGKFTVYDINTKMIKEIQFNNTNSNSIKVDAIEDGMYFYQYKSTDNSIVSGGKFLKT